MNLGLKVMKIGRMLKVLTVSISLLSSTMPAYANDGNFVSTWWGWLTGKSSDAGAGEDALDGNGGIPQAEDNVDEGSYINNSNVILCARDIPQIELHGVGPFITEITRLCNSSNPSEAYISNKDTQTNLEFCQQIRNQNRDSACYSNILNDQSYESYQNQFYNNPRVREAFIQEEMKQLEMEREKLRNISSIQFTLASDPHTVMQLRKMMIEDMRDERKFNNLKRDFNLSDETANKIKSGELPLNEFSKSVFSCTPNLISKTPLDEGNRIDNNILEGCDNPNANELVEEAHSRLTNQMGAGLMHDQAAERAVRYANFVGDEFKQLLSDRINVEDDSDMAKEAISSAYLQKSTDLIALLDGNRRNPETNNIILMDEIEKIRSNPTITGEALQSKIRGVALRETRHSMQLYYQSENMDKQARILDMISNKYISQAENGNVSFQIGNKTTSHIIEELKADGNLNPTPEEEKEMRGMIHLLAAGMSVGSQIHASMRIRDNFSNDFSETRASELLPPPANSDNSSRLPSSNSHGDRGGALRSDGSYDVFKDMFGRSTQVTELLNDFESYMNLGRDTFQDRLSDVQDTASLSNGEQCLAPSVNLEGTLRLMAITLAKDCNSIVNKDKEELQRRHCPTIANPRASNAILEGLIGDPTSLEGNILDTKANVIGACLSIEMEAIAEAARNNQLAPEGEANKAGGEETKIADQVCDPLRNMETISSDLRSDLENNFFQGMCNNDAYNGRLSDYAGSVANASGTVTVPPPDISGGDFIKKSDDDFDSYTNRFGNESGIVSNGGSNINPLDTYNGETISSPGTSQTVTSIPSGASGINSNIFDTNQVVSPTRASSFLPTVDTSAPSEDEEIVSSEQLRSEFQDSEGRIDPSIQAILDRLEAREERERQLLAEQNELRNMITSMRNGESEKDDSELEDAQKKLQAVTDELNALKEDMPGLIAKVRDQANTRNRISNFTRPSATPTPSGSRSRQPASANNNFDNAGGGFGAPASSGSGGGGSARAAAGNAQGNAGISGPGGVSADGISAPAYTASETFVLTQSIRDKAEIVPAGVSIEQAVLESKGAILVPYGNGEYMYVEPELNADGEVSIIDGRVVYKEVLKVSDPEALAQAQGVQEGSRAPASVEDFDPDRKVYKWDDVVNTLEDMQE